MQLHDALRHLHSRSLAEELAAAVAVAPARAEAALRAAGPELNWHLQRSTLSRGGLADLVEVLGGRQYAAHLGSGKIFTDATARSDGEAVLRHLFGHTDAGAGLAARIARRSGVNAGKVHETLPHMATAWIGTLALRAQAPLGEIVSQVPSLGRLSCGNAHGDLAGILRRRCGAGRYSPRALPRAVRRVIADAAGFPSRSVLVWYARFMVGRSAATLMRALGLRSPMGRSSPPAAH